MNTSARARASAMFRAAARQHASDIWNRYIGIVSISRFTTTENAATAIRFALSRPNARRPEVDRSNMIASFAAERNAKLTARMVACASSVSRQPPCSPPRY